MALGDATPAGFPPRLNQLKAGAALSYVSMALGFVIALVYTPVVLRLLGQEEFGLYTLIVSIVGYLSLLSFGLSAAYVRFYARFKAADDESGVARLNGLFLLILLVVGAAALVGGGALIVGAGTVLGDEISQSELQTARVLFAIMTVSVAVSVPLTIFELFVIANERFVLQKVLLLARTVISPLVVLPMLLLGYGSVGMAAGTAVVGLCMQLYTWAFCVRSLKMQFAFRGTRVTLLREIVTFSAYIFGNIVADQVNWNVDKYIVGWFWGTSAVAVYGVASLLNTYYMSLSSAISGVFIPRVHRLVSSGVGDRELTELFTRVGRLQFILLAGICIEFVVFGGRFVSLWAGEEYWQAYPIAVILMVPVTIPLIQNLGIEIQRAKNLHRFRSLVYLAIAGANVAVSVLLVGWIGPLGAATGTALTLVVGNGIVMNWYYQARVGLDMWYFWAQIGRLIPPALPSIILGVIYVLVQRSGGPLALATGAAMVAVTYCSSMWYFGMDESERGLVRLPLGRVLPRMRRR